MTTLILTVLGDDEPGLVSALSVTISAHGGSWGRSQMARLAGKFAGIVMVQVPRGRADALHRELEELGAQGLQVRVESSIGAVERQTQRLELVLVGADHPGIVAEISSCLAEGDIGIEDLTTDIRDAPMAGGRIFEAHAVLEAPVQTDLGQLAATLESLADELMVDLDLSGD